MKKKFLFAMSFTMILSLTFCVITHVKSGKTVVSDTLLLNNIEALATPEVEVGIPCIWHQSHICVVFVDEWLVLTGYKYS